MTDTEVRSVELLLVEDSAADARLTIEALKRGRIANSVTVFRDGEAALSYLRREGEHAEALRPDLVLLDLNLPKKSGREVLSEIRADPGLKDLPVVVLTTSAAEEDILRSYELAANCFVTKPVGLKEFMDVIQSIGHFWVNVVTLPPKH